jgi:type I restriction enzyme R subunit
VQGVQELAKEKLKDLLKLKYSAISDAVAELGSASEIGRMFGGFQRFLY